MFRVVVLPARPHTGVRAPPILIGCDLKIIRHREQTPPHCLPCHSLQCEEEKQLPCKPRGCESFRRTRGSSVATAGKLGGTAPVAESRKWYISQSSSRELSDRDGAGVSYTLLIVDLRTEQRSRRLNTCHQPSLCHLLTVVWSRATAAKAIWQ